MAGRFEGPVGLTPPHPDDDIVVYHSTTPEYARMLREQGTTGPKPTKPAVPIESETVAKMLGKKVGDTYDYEPGRGMGSGLYVTRHPAQGALYGTHSLPVHIKARDLAVPPERAHREAHGMTPWKSLNVEDGYIPGPLSPHQFGDVYTAEDHKEWDNHHG
jgi:hypothetical protein